MQDWDGRNLEVLALYHQYYEAPDLTPASDRRYWNFLDLTLDPDSSKPALTAMIRNVVDAPRDTPRGGGYLEASASQTGRNPVGWLPAFQVSPRAAVRVARLDGLPLRGERARTDGCAISAWWKPAPARRCWFLWSTRGKPRPAS